MVDIIYGWLVNRDSPDMAGNSDDGPQCQEWQLLLKMVVEDSV